MPIATQIYKSIEIKVPTLIINFNPPKAKRKQNTEKMEKNSSPPEMNLYFIFNILFCILAMSYPHSFFSLPSLITTKYHLIPETLTKHNLVSFNLP